MSDIIDLLVRRAGGAGSVTQVETHISRLVLGPDTVFKLKKAVRLPYVDFSTPELRLAACEAELALNRRTAPALYRAVHRITDTPGGGLALDGPGALLDACVEMARFDEAGLFDRLAGSGGLTPALLTELAGHIAAFHEAAPPAPGGDAAAALEAALAANEGGFAGQTLWPAADLAPLLEAFRARARALAPLLARRTAAGRVRRCHGDMHLRNICLVEGRPTLFDCLEFREDLATIDTLYDLAFLLMDLCHRDLADAANLVLNRWCDASGDDTELGLVPFYMAMRAAVRAHVAAVGGEQNRAEAEAYLALARQLLSETPPRLVAVGGLSGTGKSTLAAGLAPGLGAPPGARVLSTDRLRKALFGRAPTERLPPDAYAPEVSNRVYESQRTGAARVLAGGGSVVADGVFLKPDERAAIEAVAAEAGASFAGFWLEAPRPALEARVEARRGDPSDATREVVALQAAHDPGPVGWSRIEAGGAPGEVLAEARAHLA